jgi:hypothetical protein
MKFIAGVLNQLIDIYNKSFGLKIPDELEFSIDANRDAIPVVFLIRKIGT